MQAISLFKIVTNYRASYNKYSSLALNFTLTMNSYRYDQTVLINIDICSCTTHLGQINLIKTLSMYVTKTKLNNFKADVDHLLVWFTVDQVDIDHIESSYPFTTGHHPAYVLRVPRIRHFSWFTWHR